MIVEVKVDRKRYVFLLLVIIVTVALSGRMYSYLFPVQPNIVSVFGEVEIFVNGVWIPLKAGMDISNATLRIKGEGEIRLADRVIRAQGGEVEFIFSEKGNLEVQKGTVLLGSISENKESFQRFSPVEQINTAVTEKSEQMKEKTERDINDEKMSETVRKPEELKPEELSSLPKNITEVNMADIKGEKLYRITNFFIQGAIDEREIKLLNKRTALVEVYTENIKKIKINGIEYFSDRGKFEINFKFKEGENKIDIVGLDDSGNIVDRKSAVVLVDTKPPTVKIQKSLKFDSE
ncbi:MAG: hypothetical protein NZ927_00175 [Candidatus Calescibacterium sp.]|nr:hypothetical protein [Candidatus Calescibacterium sp.]MCX7734650.1 hypothetical protein [bacterium]